MKSITIILLFVLAGAVSFGQAQTASSGAIMSKALAEAAHTYKNVLIIFRASWCGWCHKMEDAMADEKLNSFFESNYIIVRLTVDESKGKKALENPGAVELRKKYHGEQLGLPYWVILDSKGNFLADSRLRKSNVDAKATNVGCPASNEEVAYFVEILRKTSSLNKEQLALIQQRFLKNKE